MAAAQLLVKSPQRPRSIIQRHLRLLRILDAQRHNEQSNAQLD